MSWYKKISQNTKKLSDLYDGYELNDESEAMYNYISEDMLDKEFLVQTASPTFLRKLKTFRNDITVFDAFKNFADKDQIDLVKYKMNNFDPNRIVIVANETLLDGYHQVIAAIMSNRLQKYIDIYGD